VRERLTEGDSDKQVLDFLVSRYGQFVLLRPRLEFETLLLWGLPPAALIAGAIGLFMTMRRRGKFAVETAPLSREEQQRLSALVHRDQR
jgi:cytochrome c-type biogenesis protein CcmH